MLYICMFLPAIVAASYEIRDKYPTFKKISIYAKYCIFMNFFFLCVLFLLGRGENSFDHSESVNFYLIYFFVELILSFLLPRIVRYFRKNFKIEIRSVKDEVKNKKIN